MIGDAFWRALEVLWSIVCLSLFLAMGWAVATVLLLWWG